MTTGGFGLVAGLLLAGAFAAAAIAKLSDSAGAVEAARAFGAPSRAARPIALALPIVELAVAILLLFGSTRAAGAAGALGLLVVFSTAIGVSLARGRAPDCHCFGQLHSAPTSWKTLARNGALAGIALVALGGGSGRPRPSAVGWVGDLAPVEALALGALLLTVLLAAGGGLTFVSLARAHGRTLLRLDAVEDALRDAGIELSPDAPLLELGLDPGTPAPVFSAERTTGDSVSLDDLLARGLPLVIAFTSPSCSPCRALMPRLAAWQVEHAESVTFAIASSGEPEAIRAEAEEYGLEWALVDGDLALNDAYQVSGTPSAVLISPEGTIASYVASGADEIEQLVERALDGDEQGGVEEGLPIGATAPQVDLADLEGRRVSLADPGGRETLVLFWNPGCGFCRSLLDDLLAWERHPPVAAPRLLVVSSGDEASTRADGFSSTVALDPGFEIGPAFAAGGTPMALLLDREGRIASPLAAGAEAVLSLAGGRAAAGGEAHVAGGVAT